MPSSLNTSSTSPGSQPTDHMLIPDYRARAVDNARQMKRLFHHEFHPSDKIARRRLLLAAFLKVMRFVQLMAGLPS